MNFDYKNTIYKLSRYKSIAIIFIFCMMAFDIFYIDLKSFPVTFFISITILILSVFYKLKSTETIIVPITGITLIIILEIFELGNRSESIAIWAYIGIVISIILYYIEKSNED